MSNIKIVPGFSSEGGFLAHHKKLAADGNSKSKMAIETANRLSLIQLGRNAILRKEAQNNGDTAPSTSEAF